MQRLLIVLGLWFAAARSLAGESILPPAALEPLTTATHPLAREIDDYLKRQGGVAGFKPSGLTRGDYLKLIAGQVRAMRRYQNAEGRIIDPVKKQEMYFTTPCYAHAVAALAASGFQRDPAVLESGMRAMDAAVTEMDGGDGVGGHGDFFTWPVMMAFNLYARVAPAERLARWREGLGRVNPRKLYKAYGRPEGNWTVVHLAGESLRAKAGLTTLEYLESALAPQLKNFTELGMYNETGNPLPYDHFPRHYLAGALLQGYRGKSYERCRDLIWRGAWTSPFMMSPTGQAPSGYRSSHHIWNEAQSCVTYEIYAGQYARAGRAAEAGAFKRAAHLSLSCIRDWIRPDGSGYIVKNRYPIEAEHGYESYSVHTCYNMLACSMLAQAWEFADEAVAERPAPCEVGGYVIPILEPFHKIFAAAGGSYVEYDTCGDHMYNPTGVIRVHAAGSNSQLGPSDGCAALFSGEGVNVAVGPSWRDAAGKWRSLAELSPKAPRVEILEARPERAAFRIVFEIDPAGARLRETIAVEAGGVSVCDEITGAPVTGMRVIFPLLVEDGLEKTAVRLRGNRVEMRLGGQGARFEVLEPAGTELRRTGERLGHRNGIVEPVVAEVEGTRAVYRIGAPD